MKARMTKGFRSSRVAAVTLIATSAITGTALAPSLAAAAQPHATAVSVVSSVYLGAQRVGTVGRLRQLKIANTGTTPLTLNGIAFASGDRTDFVVGTGCFPSGHAPATLAPGTSCTLAIRFVPRALKARTAILHISDSAPGSPQSLTLRGIGTEGYYLAGVKGTVAHFGDARAHGSLLGRRLSAPIISMTATQNGGGYWLLGSDGGIFSFGNARFFGSTGAMRLTRPVLGMATTPTARGYWLVAGDGGIFSFGNASFFGSTGAMRLNQPVVGMASTPTGKGYWLVARDGGIFSFGDAKFFGSTGSMRLNQPIVGMASTPSGNGYWLVAADGGIFTFGDARYLGSTGSGGFGLITGMAVTPDGGGYWISNTAGQIFVFGNAPYYGDTYRFGVPSFAAVAATAPKLQSPGFAGAVLYLRHAASAASLVPHAVPRLDGG